jgi:hypothetical protein
VQRLRRAFVRVVRPQERGARPDQEGQQRSRATVARQLQRRSPDEQRVEQQRQPGDLKERGLRQVRRVVVAAQDGEGRDGRSERQCLRGRVPD